MSSMLEGWIQDVEEAVRDAAGDAAQKAVRSAWSEHVARSQPIVVLFGPYDSGKSSLLKRLLVDAGRSVPEWLTVSSRRETFEAHQVEANGCVFVDTPGIAGGNREHEVLAQEALSVADAILVVLPPQLLTADKEAVIRVASGHDVNPDGVKPGRGLIIAISRMDEAGRDPSEDVKGYRELCEGKRKELVQAFAREGADLDQLAVFPVAPDPYQQVLNQIPSSPHVYDEFREWDGMRELCKALSALPASLELLRRTAAVRFFSGAAFTIRREVADRLAVLETSAKEAANGEERIALLTQQLDSLSSAAKVDLERVVEDQIASVVRTGFTSSEEVKKSLEPRILKALEAWRAKHDAALSKLAAEAQAEIDARVASPGGKALRLTLEEGRGGPSEKGPGLEKLKRTGAKLKDALREYHEHEMGMTVAKARDELKKLVEAGSFEKYREAAERAKGFKTVGAAEKAGKVVRFHKALDILGPVVAELGPVILQELHDRSLARQRSEQRKALRKEVERASEDLSAESWEEWKKAESRLRSWLTLQGQPYKTMLATLEAERVRLGSAQVRLVALLQSAPVDAAPGDKAKPRTGQPVG